MAGRIESDYMVSSFLRHGDGKKYYFNDDGIMQTGWIDAGKYWGSEETQWYYRYADGYMQYDSVIDGYYLGHDGAMTDMPSYITYN